MFPAAGWTAVFLSNYGPAPLMAVVREAETLLTGGS